jgi:hypothetical protein
LFFSSVYPVKEAFVLINHKDWNHPTNKTGKIAIDLKSTIGFFGQKFTLNNVSKVVRNLNREWNLKFAGKPVCF